MSIPYLLTADESGNISEFSYLEACASRGGGFFPISEENLIPLPYGSELFVLPERICLGYSREQDEIISLREDPENPGSKLYPVAAFIAPGWTASSTPAYLEEKNAAQLPLFAYTAVCWYKGGFYVAAKRVELERRQDSRLINISVMEKYLKDFAKKFKCNRLVEHLANCATCYRCPAAINLFLEKYEAPLPTSVSCNASCLGCISLQKSGCCPATQPRIEFTPSPDEVAEVSIHHIGTGPKRVVSFGQGCEGEPLTAADTIAAAIKIVRANTSRGTINLNTNASLPKAIKLLADSGLESIRVSMNSARKSYYEKYFRPRNYTYNDVLKSLKIAKDNGLFISLNYLYIPGFNDSEKEINFFLNLLQKYKIDMIQWRNLNYDPSLYFKQMEVPLKEAESSCGISSLISIVSEMEPEIIHGYFNPPKEKWSKNRTYKAL